MNVSGKMIIKKFEYEKFDSFSTCIFSKNKDDEYVNLYAKVKFAKDCQPPKKGYDKNNRKEIHVNDGFLSCEEYIRDKGRYKEHIVNPVIVVTDYE